MVKSENSVKMKDGKVRDNRYLLFFRALESIDFGNLPEISLALGIFSGKMLTEQLVRFLFNKALPNQRK